jgi:dTDP-4-amino-4,6-dideoxygalactose transaminase
MIPLFKVYMDPTAKEHVAKTLDSGFVAQGPKVEEFERKLQEHFGLPFLALNSCTSAIDLALHLCGLDEGSWCLTPTMNCTAGSSMVWNRSKNIAWVDVDPFTGNITAKTVEATLNKYHPVAAIMAVDWGGRPCDYYGLDTFGIPIIQDAAHDGFLRDSNPHGDYICLSFQAIKFLTTGDGGGLHVPPNKFKRAKLLRWFGLDRDGSDSFRCQQNIGESGYKYHMNDIAATIGLANIKIALEKNMYIHRGNAIVYNEMFKLAHVEYGPPIAQDHSYWLYTLHGVPRRDDFMKFMEENGVKTSPVHARNDKHSCFGGPSKPGEFPGTDYFDSTNVSIPVGWWLSMNDVIFIASKVTEWHNKYGYVPYRNGA